MSTPTKTVPVTFSRTGVAYDQYGATVIANNPRFQTIAGKSGILIEEGTTNLLTANQSTGTDTLGDTTGFAIVHGSETISSTTEQYFQGTKSLKCVCPGTYSTEGWKTTNITVSASTSYTASAWVRVNAGVSFMFGVTDVNDKATQNTYTGTGTWQYVSVSQTTDSDTVLVVRSYTVTSPQACTMYADMIGLEAKAYPTSWVLGGTTRNAETLTIPSSVVNLSQGTIETEIYCNTALITTGIKKYIFDANGTGYIRLFHDNASNIFSVTTNDGTHTSTVSSGALAVGWHKIQVIYGTTLTLMVDGASVGTPINNPYLPTNITSVNLGRLNDGTGQCDTTIRNISISKLPRSVADETSRALQDAPPLDSSVTFFGALQSDLKGIAKA